MIDTQRRVETPEGVDLHLTPAGPIARAEAWLLDAGIRFILMWALLVVMALLGATGEGLWLLVLFASSWLYFLLFEGLGGGATPGKRVLHLKVVHDDGTPAGWPAVIIRNILRAVDCLPVGYAAGLVSMLVSKDFRRLGDLAAGTIVVHAEPASNEILLPDAAPQPPPVALDAAERWAIVDFAQRVRTLTPERAREIARLVPALTGDGDGDRVRMLQGYAAWIVGRR